MSATNRDLKQAIKDGNFRNDLYYRLQVIPILLPPLRDRKEDIPLLANHFITMFNKEFKKDVKKVSAEVTRLFQGYSWPGNVRELRNVIERVILLEAEDKILPEHFPPEIIRGDAYSDDGTLQDALDGLYPMSIKDIEKLLINKALKETSGNKSKASRILGISRQTLREKIKLYQLV